jgi:staphylococcal nuclease domain-containing protein 1
VSLNGMQGCLLQAASWNDCALLKRELPTASLTANLSLYFSTAKEKKQFLYAQQHENGASAKGKPAAPGAAARNLGDRSIDGQVIRVWSGDQISIVDKAGKERRVQLSSTRAPKYAFSQVSRFIQ